MDDTLVTDIIEWDVRNWAMALGHWERCLRVYGVHGGRALCLGERNGGISLWLALRGFEVICTDRNGPTDLARTLHAKHGVSDRITYAPANVFQLAFPDGAFDVVACKSVIGGLKLVTRDPTTRTLENQKLAVDESRRVLRPGGVFLGAENMRGSLLHRAGRRLRRGKNLGWRHLQRAETEWLWSDFASTDIEYFGFIGSHYRRDTLNRVASRIDAQLSRLFPSSWLYIAFIAAMK